VGGCAGIAHQRRGPVEECAHALEQSRGRRGIGGCHQAPRPGVGIRCEIGGPFQCRRGGRVAAPGARTLGRLLERLGGVFVESVGRRRPVPGPAVHVRRVRERLGERGVHPLSSRRRCVLIHRGAHERVAELHVHVVEAQESRCLGRGERVGRASQGRRGANDHVGLAEVLGRRHEQDRLCVVGEVVDASQEGALHGIADRQRVGQGLASAQMGRRQRGR
jgi:hypothetical protein